MVVVLVEIVIGPAVVVVPAVVAIDAGRIGAVSFVVLISVMIGMVVVVDSFEGSTADSEHSSSDSHRSNESISSSVNITPIKSESVLEKVF